MEIKPMEYTGMSMCDILYQGKYLGYSFVIINRGTHPVAYVECKFDCVNGYDDIRLGNINVHGGFTYYGESYWNYNKPNNKKYLGWDYGHYGDYSGYCAYISEMSGDKKWATDEIYNEVKYVIEQLKNMEDIENENKKD